MGWHNLWSIHWFISVGFIYCCIFYFCTLWMNTNKFAVVELFLSDVDSIILCKHLLHFNECQSWPVPYFIKNAKRWKHRRVLPFLRKQWIFAEKCFFFRWQLDFLETVYFLTNYLFFLVGKIDLQKEFQITKVEYCPRIVYSHDRALSSLVYKWFYYEPNSHAGNIYCLFWLTPCTVWYFLCSEMEDEMNLHKNLDKDS